MKSYMKVGVLIDSNTVRNFEYEILKGLNALEVCQTVICIIDSNIKLQRNPLLNGYLKFDAVINARGKNHIAKKSIGDLNIETLSSLDQIAEQKFDLLVNLGTQKLSDEIISFPKYGVWELKYGEVQNSANMAGIIEVFKSSNTTIITLNKLPDSTGDGYIVDKFLCATHDLSPVKNRSDTVWRSHTLVLQNIEKLALHRDSFIKEKMQNLYFFKDKEFNSPKLLETLFPVLKLGFKNITSRFDKLFRKQQWSIYFALNTKDNAFNQNMSDFKEIPTPKEFFWADPFVVDKDDKSYIFFEEYVYKTHKGHLSVVEYDHCSGKISEAREVLNTPYHLSYPFIMEHEGEFYMIPEGSKDRDIKLYRAKNFPLEWEEIRTLIDNIVAVDTTLFYKDNSWWMFTNVAEYEGLSLNDELYIYHCKDFLKDEWIPHTQNPVISSLQTSRPAGGIIDYEGDYYRPSQNSVGWYGRSTNFNKILTLTPDVYKEKFVSEITPDFIDGIYAVHTYNSSKRLTVVDGLKKIKRFL